MKTTGWFATRLSVALAAAALTNCASANAEDDIVVSGGPVEFQVKPLRVDVDAENLFVLAEADDKEGEAGATEYWLGVQVAEVPEIAKRQLGIEYGLAVEDVAPNSPAAKAEIKKFDILLQAGEKPLARVDNLVKSVEAAQGKQIVITLKREGQSKKVEVIAEQKAKAEAAADAVRRKIELQKPKLAAEIKQLEEAMEKLKAAAGKEGFGMWFAKPAIVGPAGVHREWDETTKGKVQQWQFDFNADKAKADLPKDLSVQINKKGNEPTTIHVKKNDQEWEVTEDKVGDLPADIRIHVQKMLGHMKGPTVIANAERKIRLSPDGKIEGEFKIPPMPPMPPKPAVALVRPNPPAPPATTAKPAAGTRTITARVERDSDAIGDKLDAIMRKLDKLEKEIDELRDTK